MNLNFNELLTIIQIFRCDKVHDVVAAAAAVKTTILVLRKKKQTELVNRKSLLAQSPNTEREKKRDPKFYPRK